VAKQNLSSDELKTAIFKLPAADAGSAAQVCNKLAAGGPAVVKALVGMVGQEFGDSNGAVPKFALHGLAVYSARPGSEKDRKMVAETLARQLEANHSADLKAFIVRQLQFCGRAEEAPALAKLLTDAKLCEPAAQALLAIGGEKATAALRGALGGAKGKRRVTILNAVGRLGDKGSAAAARKSAADQNTDVRLAALYALGNMGDAESIAVLTKAATGKDSYERTQATDACLLLARRLAEQGDKKSAAGICRSLSAARKDPGDAHDRCAALAVLAETTGADAVSDVMAAMDSQDPRICNPAARTAVRLASAITKDHGAEAKKLLAKVAKATKEQAVLQEARLLGARADK